MKKLIPLLVWLCLFYVSAGDASAALIDMKNETGHVIFDDQTGKYWYWDLSDFNILSYEKQLTAIDQLNIQGNPYFGLNTWHMATEQEFLQLSSGPNLVSDYRMFGVATMGGVLELYRARLDTATEDVPVYVEDPYTGELIIEYYPAHLYTYIYIGPPYEDLFRNELRPLRDGVHGTYGAWVTTNVVPIPSVIWLLGSGLIGLVGFRRKFGRRFHDE